ncbi:MAG: DUF5615 family PIN-like protein [Chloroflexi bacterium]|nr:DUF5615 family PIN-like protein [Chloroflexota bacterium]MDA1272351.1 DUF5615 family PIN-like protein [Chloroflexota bacterium]PKB58442.1 MAG: hypothetical protein BZY83_07080 [SAR202 cluster bacterium Casp-Chloro-G2]
MRLLFDQNLSPLLIGLLSDLFPGSIHVRDVGLQTSGDTAIWDYAIREQVAIISKDSDFRQRSFLLGSPPKVVWIRRGNCSTNDVEAIIRAHHGDLLAFDQAETATFLALE